MPHVRSRPLTGSLTKYALRISRDPAELAQFQLSIGTARTAMTAAGLSESEQDLMLSGDQRRIGAALSADALRADFASEPRQVPARELMEMPTPEPMEMPPPHTRATAGVA